MLLLLPSPHLSHVPTQWRERREDSQDCTHHWFLTPTEIPTYPPQFGWSNFSRDSVTPISFKILFTNFIFVNRDEVSLPNWTMCWIVVVVVVVLGLGSYYRIRMISLGWKIWRLKKKMRWSIHPFVATSNNIFPWMIPSLKCNPRSLGESVISISFLLNLFF
jgi:hypothetical protein